MAAAESAEKELESGLTHKLLSVFDTGADSRRAYYEANPKKVPALDEVDAIITRCANTNAMISGGLSLIPGPWGLVATIPEIVLVIQNQVTMIYDVGVAYGKKDVLTREMILSIALAASGVSAVSLLTMHGSKVLIRRSSLRVFQNLVKVFAGKVSQQVLKSAIAKWLPVVGAAAIAAWTRYSTFEIGKKAKEIFSRDIELGPDEVQGDVRPEAADAPPPSAEATITKLLILDDLMRCDGEEHKSEHAFINELLANSGMGPQDRALLVSRFGEPFPRGVDYTPFLQDTAEAIGLLMDMAALARRDGQVRQSERDFILGVGRTVGLSERQVDLALT